MTETILTSSVLIAVIVALRFLLRERSACACSTHFGRWWRSGSCCRFRSFRVR
jgi:hypothetical protein